MNRTKSFFFMVLAVAGSAVQAKSLVFQSDIFYEISHGNTKAVKALVTFKSNLSVKNEQGQSLLHAAVLTGNRKMVKILVKAGVAINELNLQGKTALDLSVESDHIKMMYYLVKNGGKVTTQQNLLQAQFMIKKYIKKIMRLFWYIGPFAILTAPIWMVPWVMITIPFPVIYQLFATVMPGVFFYSITIPLQASTLMIRSRRLNLL